MPALFRRFRPRHQVLLCMLLWGSLSFAQTPKKAPPADSVSPAERAVSLAQSGHCKEALPLLEQATSHVAATKISSAGWVCWCRCAMMTDHPDAAEDFLRFLNREFPKDPEVLYLSVHRILGIYRAAPQPRPATTAPSPPKGGSSTPKPSRRVGRWDEAAKEYRLILQQDPRMAGIHFRIGRLLLSKPNPSPTGG